jgi:uncharacterized membrane protein
MRAKLKRLVALNVHSLFVITASVFGIFFVFTTPLLWGSDETSHVGRVYQISHGHVFARVVHQGYSGYGFGGTIPSNLMRVVNYVNTDFNVNTHQVIPGVKWVDQPADYKTFYKLPLSGRQLEYNFSNTATYPPVAYIPSVIGFKVAELFKLHIGPTIYLTRIFGLAFYIAAIAYVLRALRPWRIKWLIFSVALLPMALFQASVINADIVTNTLTLILVGLLIKALLVPVRLSRLETTILVISVLCLPVVKPSYIFISLLALLVPARRLPTINYRNLLLPLSVLLGILAFGVWQYKTRYLSNAPKYIIAGVVPWWQQIDSAAQIKYVIHHPITYMMDFLRTILLTDNIYFESLFGRLGFDYVQVPAFAIIASFVAMVLSVVGAEPLRRIKKFVPLVTVVIILSVLAVFGTLYLTISSVGSNTIQGVQGRYLLPVLPIILLLLVYITKTRLSFTKFTYRNYAMLVSGLVISGLLASAIKFYYITWG